MGHSRGLTVGFTPAVGIRISATAREFTLGRMAGATKVNTTWTASTGRALTHGRTGSGTLASGRIIKCTVWESVSTRRGVRAVESGKMASGLSGRALSEKMTQRILNFDARAHQYLF